MIEAIERRMLLSVSLDGQGWTQITPAPGARVYYVSSSAGSDSNDGLSPQSPLASIVVGVSKLRDHSADELLLACGDVWHAGLAVWRKSGKSADEPMVIGSYGSGARPLLMSGKEPGVSVNASSDPEIDHLAIIGLHFYADARDPASPTYVGRVNATGIDVLTKTDGLLVEDCEIQDYGDNINVEKFYGPIENVSIRRNVIVDAYSTNSHSQGIYCNGVTNLLIEGNVFDHNGYNAAVPGADPTWYNHDCYIASNNSNVTVDDNIFAEASGYGLQARSGGHVQDNLFLYDPVGMSFGLVNGASVTPGGVNGIVNGNVIEGGANIGTIPLGEGMELGNTRAGYPTVVSNNIFTQGINRAPAAITLQYGIGDTNADSAVGINDLTLQGNIIYNWYRGVHVDGGFTPGGTGLRAFDGVRIQQNDFQLVGGTAVAHDDPFYKGQELWSDNRYSSADQIVNGKKDFSAEQWNQSEDAGGQVSDVAYADASRTVETYNLALGGAGTLADFLAQARAQSHQTWQAQYDAESAIAYFRDGFSQAGVARDWRPPTPPIASAVMPPAALDRDSSMQFVVTYVDDKAVDPATIASGNVSVLMAHSKWSTPATLVGISGSGATISATYVFTPPGGSFRLGQGKRFTLATNAGQVKDMDGFPVNAQSLGSFRVRVLKRPKPPTVKSVATIHGNQGIIVRFSADVSASLQVGDLVLQSEDGQTIDPSLMTLSTDAAHDSAVWTFPGEPDGVLPAGRWHVRVLAASVMDAGGRQLDGNRDEIGGDDFVLVKPLVVKG
ncbi:MAG TPA: right-handed parallel beta-helix repeat-containing protein [Humisphaera sp.]|jgi:hypothetical protein|nr:right-handed parallel beta-helix repeat-containing protein [Humisphaera sp.]